MRKFAYPVFICLLFVSISFAQNLTVREIMAEPSIAGMRVASEKLSPDGSKVVFLWNAEGMMPLDIYMSSTDRPAPFRILSLRDLPPPPPRTEPESKLTYGLTVRDDFVKERENTIGNLEWSPDSKKILFTQNGDLYILNLENAGTGTANTDKWANYEAAMVRRADLVPNIVKTAQMSGVREAKVFGDVAEARSDFFRATIVKPAGNYGTKSIQQQQEIILASEKLSKALERLLALRDTYPILRSSESFSKMLDELTITENRIRIARDDHNTAGENARPRRLTKTQSAEVAARFLDNGRILFQQNGNLFVLNTVDAALIQLTKEANPATFISVVNVNPNKAGSLLAYVVSDGSKQKALFVPNYLDDFVLAPTVRRGWSEQKLMVVPTDGSRDTPFEIKLPKAEGASSFRTIRWAADGANLIVDRNDKDTKRRQLYYVENVGSKGEKAILLTEETDEKWIAPLSALVEPNPKDAGQIVFGSEKDGYNHLYLAKLTKNKPEPNPAGEIRGENPMDTGYSSDVKIEQLTNGRWQVEWAKWVVDGSQLIYSSTQDGTAGREIYSILPGSGDKRVLAVSAPGKGMKASLQLDDSNDQPTLLYEYSKWNQPGDLYAIKVCPRCRGTFMPERITMTAPEAFLKRQWNVPEFVDIPTKDNKTVPAKIYLPANLDRTKKHPMVIFVHGAGYLQNVTDGWNNYYREFLFNELLTQKGYVVLDIDYRGSAGYGRDWRTDVYDFLGGPDMQDHLDAIDFTVKNYPVNINKIGVYGGSYGGFMAEMLAMRAPDKIAAAAALRPVADWKNYYASSPVYTAQRLGFPDKNPKAYERSSPISYADKLTRPLLILHGMVDDNVHAQDSMQLIEKLIRLGKTQYFEAMLYPVENHAFTRPSSWIDEYERILAFFEKHLK